MGGANKPIYSKYAVEAATPYLGPHERFRIHSVLVLPFSDLIQRLPVQAQFKGHPSGDTNQVPHAYPQFGQLRANNMPLFLLRRDILAEVSWIELLMRYWQSKRTDCSALMPPS